MALLNPSTLYSENQGIFDSRPYVKAEQQLQAQRQAKDEALDKYFNDLPNRLNSAGLADEDIPGLNQRVDQLKQYWLQNKDAIRKGGAARYNYEKGIRETNGYVEQGKNKAKSLLEVGKRKFDKNSSWMFDDPTVAETVHSGSLAMDDPNYKALDLATLTIPVKELDESAHQKFLGTQYKPDGYAAPKIEQDPNDKFKDIVTETPIYKEKTLDNIALGATERYHYNRSYRKRIDDLLEDPDYKQQLSNLYKETYGFTPTSNEQLSTAYDISKLKSAAEKVRMVPNVERKTDAANAEWGRRNKITFAQSMAKIAANKQAGLPAEDIGYLSDNVADDVGVVETVRLNGKDTERKIIYVDAVDPERLNTIIGKDLPKKNPGVKPIPIKQKDGTVKLGYYQDLGTGDWEGLDGQKISREAVKDRYVNKFAPSKFKAKTNTKASENTTGKPAAKTKANPLGLDL